MTDACEAFGTGGRRSDGSYGGSFPRSPGAPSRRQVTVLFSDLVSWTETCEQLDEEAAREILTAYHDRCRARVEACGGTVGQFQGDGMLAFFGHPKAYEDNGYRAVLTGLRIVDDVGALTREMAPTYDVELAVRVGIHSGLVIAEELGDPLEPNVVGSPLNIAHRIQSEAQPGTVLISDATYDLVQGRFHVVSEGRRSLRGVARPMPLYRVLGPTGAETRFEASRHLTGLVNREAELDALEAAWGRATQGGVHAIVVTGDAGIGKSRLVEAAQRHIATAGGTCCVLQCSSHHLNSAFYPLARFVGRHGPELDGRDEASEELLAQLLDVGATSAAASIEATPEQRRELIFGAFRSLMRNATGVKPLLLIAEDLHWSDPSTLELLRRLLQADDIDRLLVVMTTRPTSAPFFGAEVPSLELEPFAPEHRLKLVASVAAGAPVSAADSELISKRSDGVPLYIEELTRILTRAGEPAEPGDARPRQDIVGAVPSTLQDLLTARLDQFPGEKHIAQLVAAIGPSVPIPVLQQLLGLPQEGDVRAAVAPLVEARILQETEERISTSLSFRHALLRDAAYDSQLRSERRALHRKIADVLVDSFPEIVDAEPERLAEHLSESGDHRRASELWVRAGQRVATQAAHAEAAAHFRHALDALMRSQASGQPPDPALEVVIQSGLGYSLLPLQGYTSPEAEVAFRRAVELTSTAHGSVDVATRFGLWAYHTVVGDHTAGLNIAAQSMATAEAAGRENHLLLASGLLGYQRFYLGQFDIARALLEVGARYQFPESETSTPHDPGVASLVLLAPLLWITGHPADARAALDEGLARAGRLVFPIGPFTRAYAHTYAAWFYQLTSEPEQSVEHARITMEISREYGFATWLGAGWLHHAIASSMLGPPHEAIPMIEQGVAAWKGAGANLFLPYFLFRLADARRRAGDPKAALLAVEEGLADTTRRDERFVEAVLRTLRGELLWEVFPERREDAASELRAAVSVARDQGARTFELRAATTLHALQGTEESGDGLRQVLASFRDAKSMRELDDARALCEGVA